MATTTETSKSRLAERDRVRLHVDLPTEDANLIEELGRRTGYNKTTTVVRALHLLDDLDRATREGATVIIERPDGTRERLRLL